MRSVLAGIVAVVIGTLPALALDGPGRALLGTNTVQITDRQVQTGAEGNPVSSNFIPPYSGTVRVKWDVKSKDGTEILTDVGVTHVDACSKTTTSTAFVSQSCDLRVTGGMVLRVTAFPSDSANKATLRNVSVSYNVVDFDGKAITYELPAVQ